MNTIETEIETTVTTGMHRRVKVTHNEHGTYLLLEDMMPDDLRDGPQAVSARLEPGEARVVAEALTQTTDDHDRERQPAADRDEMEDKIDDLRDALNDALARAEDRLARLRDAYSDLMADTRRTRAMEDSPT